jgi:hypothetical protein
MVRPNGKVQPRYRTQSQSSDVQQTARWRRLQRLVSHLLSLRSNQYRNKRDLTSGNDYHKKSSFLEGGWCARLSPDASCETIGGWTRGLGYNSGMG